jgi:hypothetical protein
MALLPKFYIELNCGIQTDTCSCSGEDGIIWKCRTDIQFHVEIPGRSIWHEHVAARDISNIVSDDIVAFDNVSYRTMQENKATTSTSSKAKIQNWLIHMSSIWSLVPYYGSHAALHKFLVPQLHTQQIVDQTYGGAICNQICRRCVLPTKPLC